MAELEKVSYGLRCMCYGDVECEECPYARDGSGWHDCRSNCAKDAIDLLKEQEVVIRQLRLALDIAKGTCNGIKSGGGQFADMPTMQSAT